MKVINKTTKVIGIGDATVLPGEFATIPDAVAASDMVQHFAKIGKVALEPDDAAKTTGGKRGGKGKNSGKGDPPADPPAGSGEDGGEGGGDGGEGGGDGTGGSEPNSGEA